MKNTSINTVEELTSELGVKEISAITEDNIPQIIKLLPKIDPALTDLVIKAIPVSAEALEKLVNAVDEMYDKGIVGEVITEEAVKKAYQTILERINKASQKDDLSFEELKKYTDEELKIAREMADLWREKQKFVEEMQKQKKSLIIWLVVIIVIAIVLGILSVVLPGIILEILVATFCVVAIIITLIVFGYRKKQMKLKYKQKNNVSIF